MVGSLNNAGTQVQSTSVRDSSTPVMTVSRALLFWISCRIHKTLTSMYGPIRRKRGHAGVSGLFCCELMGMIGARLRHPSIPVRGCSTTPHTVLVIHRGSSESPTRRLSFSISFINFYVSSLFRKFCLLFESTFRDLTLEHNAYRLTMRRTVINKNQIWIDHVLSLILIQF